MIDLSVVLPAHGEAALVTPLLPRLHQALATTGCRAELLVVLAPADGPVAIPDGVPARAIHQHAPGYGEALRTGFREAAGEWVLTLDADTVDADRIAVALWTRRHDADVIVGSRYVDGGEARMPFPRATLSRALNAVFGRGLSLGIRDLSSGLRLYRAAAIRALHDLPPELDVLQTILVQVYAEGWTVAEVPVRYAPGPGGQSHVRAWRFAADYARTFWRLWKLRNSIECADYDARAHDSAIPLQRYWQRSRHRHVTDLIAGAGPVLDVGCGSSRIIGALPPGSVAVDVLLRKLRYDRRFGRPRVQASGFALPFADASFPCVLCSQVIEHVPKESPILARAGARARSPAAVSSSARPTTPTGSGWSPNGSTARWRPAPTPMSTSPTTHGPSSSAASRHSGSHTRRRATSCAAS